MLHWPHLSHQSHYKLGTSRPSLLRLHLNFCFTIEIANSCFDHQNDTDGVLINTPAQILPHTMPTAWPSLLWDFSEISLHANTECTILMPLDSEEATHLSVASVEGPEGVTRCHFNDSVRHHGWTPTYFCPTCPRSSQHYFCNCSDRVAHLNHSKATSGARISCLILSLQWLSHADNDWEVSQISWATTLSITTSHAALCILIQPCMLCCQSPSFFASLIWEL